MFHGEHCTHCCTAPVEGGSEQSAAPGSTLQPSKTIAEPAAGALVQVKSMVFIAGAAALALVGAKSMVFIEMHKNKMK